MNETTFRRLQNTIRSLENSTELTMQANSLRCRLTGRNSPFVSHRGVTYDEVPGPRGILFYNTRYWLLVNGAESWTWETFRNHLPDWLVDRPDQIGYSVHMVTEKVPAGLLKNLLGCAEEYLGHKPDFAPNDLVPATFGIGVLAGFFDSRPVFRLAGPRPGDNDLVARQGSLSIYTVSREAVHPLLPWTTEGRLLNHWYGTPVDPDRRFEHPAGELAGCLAWVLVNGGEIVSPDHPGQALRLPEPAGGQIYLAAHPWPWDGRID